MAGKPIPLLDVELLLIAGVHNLTEVAQVHRVLLAVGGSGDCGKVDQPGADPFGPNYFCWFSFESRKK
ncbi:hypothetical protein CMK14_12465 [Candidatus Poribacteria bacterium]|nr:hypothetical protein [Candidatus Poribacteria bacterium]